MKIYIKCEMVVETVEAATEGFAQALAQMVSHGHLPYIILMDIKETGERFKFSAQEKPEDVVIELTEKDEELCPDLFYNRDDEEQVN